MISHLELATVAHKAARSHPGIPDLFPEHQKLAGEWMQEGFKLGYLFANEPKTRVRKAKKEIVFGERHANSPAT